MPNRIIRESCRTSATLYQLSHGAERLFWRMTTIADDYGRFEADPRVLLAHCFPLWAGSIKIKEIIGWYDQMTIAGLVIGYWVNGKQLGFFPTWETHQRVRAKHSKYPAPTSDNMCGHALANVPEKREANTEGTTEKRESTDTTLPLIGTAATGPPTNGVQFHTPGSILAALDRAPKLGVNGKLRAAAYWQAELRANPGVDYPAEILKAEAWLTSNPDRHYKKLPAFLHNWLGRAERVGA